MKVFHIFKTYYPDTLGGIEQSIRQICLETSKVNIENTVMTTSAKIKRVEISKRPECRLIRYPVTFEIASNPFSLAFLRDYKRRIAEADIVHFYFPWPSADLTALLRRTKKPFIITYQSDIVKQKRLYWLYKPLMWWFLKRANLITVSTEQYLKSSPVLSRLEKKCRIVSMGIAPETYPKINPNLKKRWQHELGTDYFLFIGVLRYYKGLHFLIEALKGSKHHLVVAGDGQMRKQLEEQAQKLNVAAQVKFIGIISDEDKVILMNDCRAFVFPSHLRSEAFGISLLESAMCAKPMISCEIGTGTSFVNKNDETGYVVEPANVAALREAMDKLAGDKELAARLGKNAKDRFNRLFSARKMGEKIIAAYTEIYPFQKKTNLSRKN